MEVAGVDTSFACNHCICAICEKGAINPKGTNTCNQGCLTCESESRDGPRNIACPCPTVIRQEV